VKIFAQYLSHIIDPQAYTMPHDRHSFLMKFSKIKAYENKKAIMNIRPYVEKMVTISELGLSAEEIVKIFRDGKLWGQKIHGIAGILLISWLINDSLKAKSLS
jgi:predicted patatin/cPLA2 family phospholipase